MLNVGGYHLYKFNGVMKKRAQVLFWSRGLVALCERSWGIRPLIAKSNLVALFLKPLVAKAGFAH